ncbi:tyrosine-type recombinase/integrase [Endozoicomonas sp. ALB115]|uniref:tyrosine-type recombinase/integrase n=1 Tax=Endozoicomonas sp. ALB115 TaxID=3403074 RepID=UPI003BB6B76E
MTVSAIQRIKDKELFLTTLEEMGQDKEAAFKSLVCYLVQMNTGLRNIDVINLKWSDLGISDIAYIDHLIEQKTKKVQVALVINGIAFQKLMELRKRCPNDVYVFEGNSRRSKGKPITRKTVTGYLKIAEEKSGIQVKIGTHSARKTYAFESWLYGCQEDETIKEAMNHSTVKMTQRYSGTVEWHKKAANLSVINTGYGAPMKVEVSARSLALEYAQS